MPAILEGYFRYTDVWFEWHQALPNKGDGSPLKAILAHDSLVHPDHPLRNGDPRGIELYMGTLQNYESRLLFSSKQVEYIREWLFATGLTRTRIPIPYSDCLLTESELRNVAPIYFTDGGELRNSIKKIEKSNKRLKGTNPILKSRRQTFELVRTFYSDKVGAWCAIDIEAWDRDHSLITEFGWSVVRWENGEEIQEQGHLGVQERRKYSNTFIPNNRDRYNFGESQFVDKNEFKKKIQVLISGLSKNGPLYLIFHDYSQDIKYLKSTAIEAPITGLMYTLPDARPDNGIWVIDTGELFAALEGESTGNKRGLERICRLLQIPTEWLHNAGNDAHYTLLALKAMASGDPVDLQREKRWPNHTGETTAPGPKGVKVEFKPWEEDSDYSDQEGMIGYDAMDSDDE